MSRAGPAGGGVGTARIHDLDPGGRGVGRVDGKTMFVHGALPGETVVYRRLRRRRSYDEAVVQEVLEPSPDRVEPRCRFYERCGGCSLQHLSREAQLRHKERILLRTLSTGGDVAPREVLPPLAGSPWRYRRKARLGARYVTGRGALVGFRERRPDRVADMTDCEVLADPLGPLVMPLRALVGSLDANARIPQIEVAAGEDAAVLVIRHLDPLSTEDLAAIEAFGHRYGVGVWLQPGGPDTARAFVPAASGLRYTLAAPRVTLATDPGVRPAPASDPHRSPAASGFVAGADAGPGVAASSGPHDSLDDPEVVTGVVIRPGPRAATDRQDPREGGAIRLAFSPLDFVQVNAEVNRALVQRVVSMVAPAPGEKVLDAFCGLGNFSLPLAARGAAVTGLEAGAEMVERARANAAGNALPASFHRADLGDEAVVRDWLHGGWAKLLIDPPRAGAGVLVDHVPLAPPSRIVYVSCNPDTLARDAARLVHGHGYTLTRAGLVDMFPHTSHIESVAEFELAERGDGCRGHRDRKRRHAGGPRGESGDGGAVPAE